MCLCSFFLDCLTQKARTLAADVSDPRSRQATTHQTLADPCQTLPEPTRPHQTLPDPPDPTRPYQTLPDLPEPPDLPDQTLPDPGGNPEGTPGGTRGDTRGYPGGYPRGYPRGNPQGTSGRTQEAITYGVYTGNFKCSWPQTGRHSHTNYIPRGSEITETHGW